MGLAVETAKPKVGWYRQDRRTFSEIAARIGFYPLPFGIAPVHNREMRTSYPRYFGFYFSLA